MKYKHVITGETKEIMEIWDIAAVVVDEKEKTGQWIESRFKETHKELALLIAKEYDPIGG